MTHTKRYINYISYTNYYAFIVLLNALLVFNTAMANDEEQLPQVTLLAVQDLRIDANIARDKRIPILLYFGSEYCSYCQSVEESQLKPMLRNRNYDNKVLVRHVNINNLGKLYNFNGQSVSTDQLASLYQAGVVPTLIFIDSNGKEIAPRIIGMSSYEFYGGYLDDSIDIALRLLR